MASSWWAVLKAWCVQGKDEGEKQLGPQEISPWVFKPSQARWADNGWEMLTFCLATGKSSQAKQKGSRASQSGEEGKQPGRSLLRD